LLLKTSFKLQNRQQLTSSETLRELVYIRQNFKTNNHLALYWKQQNGYWSTWPQNKCMTSSRTIPSNVSRSYTTVSAVWQNVNEIKWQQNSPRLRFWLVNKDLNFSTFIASRWSDETSQELSSNEDRAVEGGIRVYFLPRPRPEFSKCWFWAAVKRAIN